MYAAWIDDLARSLGYGTCSLKNARALVEMLCGLLNARFCGVFWRIGGANGAEAAAGHWVAASHIPSAGDWRTHVWFFKDSMAPAAKKQTTDEVLSNLETAVRGGAEFRAGIDPL